MSRAPDFRGKRVVVMGLGLHGGGLSTATWLLKHGARVLVTDTKTRTQLLPSLRRLPRNPRLAFALGGHRLEDFRSADLIVQNPGVPYNSPYLVEARKNGIEIANEATLFFDACPTQQIIAVTGSKGKSTTSVLTAALLKAQYGKRVFLAGNIRTTPMLSIVDRLSRDAIVVLELSSWQLEPFAWHKHRPHIAVVTNLLDDHLDRYPSRAAYYRAKSLIWRWQTAQDCTILNAENTPSLRWKGKTPGRTLWFSTARTVQHGAYVRDGLLTVRLGLKEKVIAQRTDIPLPGSHMVSNALAAILVARLYHVPGERIRRTLRAFRGVPSRMERVRTVREVAFYNDTTATAPDATIAALNSFVEKPILIAGGVDKKLEYQNMARAIRARAKALILLPGSATEKLKKLLGAFSYQEASSMAQAVRMAAGVAERGDTVILSPGAASFGLFQHEFDRGEKFVRAVKGLRQRGRGAVLTFQPKG